MLLIIFSTNVDVLGLELDSSHSLGDLGLTVKDW